MKKFTITAMVIGVALLLAVPAMAVDLTWDGHIRVRGYVEKNAPMNDTEDDYNAFYDMRMRTNWTLKVADNLLIRTRWRALNQIGGGTDSGSNNFDWERAWMSIRSPYGTFEAGRMITQTFGTTFVDNETDVFRLNYITRLADKVTLVVTAQKAAESDGGYNDTYPVTRKSNWQVSDNDVDVYGFALVYPTENWTLGSLQVWLRQRAGGADADRYSANPFFTGKFGNLGLQAEALFYFGDSEEGAASGDYQAMAANVEANYDIGMANIMGGLAYASGDDDPTDGDVENIANGDDWEKFFLLFGSTGDSPAVLGGVGNFSNTGGNTDGYTAIYAGADTNLTESFNVGLSAVWCMVNETDPGIDDDAGVEVNLRGTWQIYDNLSYSFIGAYLFAGDYWEDSSAAVNGADGNDDDPWALFHVLQLNF
jgi:hypothetical protein